LANIENKYVAVYLINICNFIFFISFCLSVSGLSFCLSVSGLSRASPYARFENPN